MRFAAIIGGGSIFQLGEQLPGRYEIGTLEAFGEPGIDGRQHASRLAGAALPNPQLGKAFSGAQLPRQRELLTRQFE